MENTSYMESPTRPEKIPIHFLKTSDFRPLSMDGVFGGVTPHGRIAMSVFSERLPLPQMIVHRVTEEGTLGDELQTERVTKAGIIRDVQAVIYFDSNVAKSLIGWLKDQLEILEQIQQAENAENATGGKQK